MAKRETDMRNKADILYENLVQTIEAIPPGEQLPSVRQLMYRHSVCQQVVVQVLDRLEKYGRIVRRPGKGVFRAGGVRSGPFRLALATPDWPALQYSEFEARLIQEGKKREFEIERVYFSLSGHNIFHELPIREYHAVVLLGNRPLSIDDLNLIANSPTPMLLIGRTFYGTGLNYIGSDPMKNGMLAARYLLDCGHRNIGVVVSESREFEIARQRLDGFRFWAENHSCRLTVIDPEIRSGGDPAQKSYEAMKYLLALGSASQNAELILERLELTACFDAVIDGTKISRAKPDPEVFVKGASALGVEPEECIVFEDSAAGIRAAHAGGMKAIGIGNRENLPEADGILDGFCGIIPETVEAMLI